MIAELVIFSLLACFALVVFVGPPYVPTLSPQVKAALDLLDLQPGQTMIELGCGDGRVLVAAAQRGWRVVGIELNPLLVLFCRLRTWRYRKLVQVRWGNYWNFGLWPPADGIFGFVLPKYMSRLDAMILRWQRQIAIGRGDVRPKPLRLASFAFQIPGKKVVRQVQGVFLYEY